MSEAEQVQALLALRLSAGGYQDVRIQGSQDDVGLMVRAQGASVLIYFRTRAERIQDVLTFVLPDGSSNSHHLNRWERGSEPGTVSQLIDAMWLAFWGDEIENREAGRSLWMRGPLLPEVEEPRQEEPGTVLDIFG